MISNHRPPLLAMLGTGTELPTLPILS